MINRRIFNDEHVAFRDSVRQWAAAELAPHGEQWRAEGMVPKSARKKTGTSEIMKEIIGRGLGLDERKRG